MKTRYTYGGDEHIYVEVDDEMSLDAFFKSLSMSNAVRNADIKGVTEICPANASFQVRYDPDIIAPEEMMKKVQELEDKAEDADKRLKTRIIEIPVYYQDPWTHETLMRFRERHQDPSGTDQRIRQCRSVYRGPSFATVVRLDGGLCCRAPFSLSAG